MMAQTTGAERFALDLLRLDGEAPLRCEVERVRRFGVVGWGVFRIYDLAESCRGVFAVWPAVHVALE